MISGQKTGERHERAALVLSDTTDSREAWDRAEESCRGGIAEGEQNIAKQKKLVAELERLGADVGRFRVLLVEFEQRQRLHVAYADRLRERRRGTSLSQRTVSASIDVQPTKASEAKERSAARLSGGSSEGDEVPIAVGSQYGPSLQTAGALMNGEAVQASLAALPSQGENGNRLVSGQGLRLNKAFLEISGPLEREVVVALAEELAKQRQSRGWMM